MRRISYGRLRLRKFVPRSLLHSSAAYISCALILGLGGVLLGHVDFLPMLYADIVFYIGIGLLFIGLFLLLLFFADLEAFRHIIRHIDTNSVDESLVSLSDSVGDFNSAIENRQGLSDSRNRNTRDLMGLVNSLIIELSRQRRVSEAKLAIIISRIPYGVLVVNVHGLVSFANVSVHGLLGREGVRVGTSIFAVLLREDYEVLLEQARKGEGGVCDGVLGTVFGVSFEVQLTLLPQECGAMIFFKQQPEVGGDMAGDIGYDLSLLSSPTPVSHLRDSLPLIDTPFVVMDTETTGLDVVNDRIIAFACVRMQGRSLFPHLNADILINPEVPIPMASQNIHGISDDMVLGQKNFADSWDEIVPHLDKQVLVGHNIGFDIAFLHRQAGLSGVVWRPEYFLDTCLLAGALNPDLRTLELDDVLEHYGIDILGRHTALGDSYMTASLLQSLLTEMLEHDVRTLGDAYELQMGQRDMLAIQRRENWFAWQDKA